jgi:predicted DCC family thiol-disulfide oxidoreductase YuxK
MNMKSMNLYGRPAVGAPHSPTGFDIERGAHGWTPVQVHHQCDLVVDGSTLLRQRLTGQGKNADAVLIEARGWEALIMTATTTANPVLLYDGRCGFCNKSVQHILRHDKQKTMFFAALQSDYGKSILTRHPELKGVDSLVFVEPLDFAYLEQVFVRSDAALKVARYLGGPWSLGLAAYILPRAVRDYLYDQFAKRRYRWFGKYDSCSLPAPEVRARFLD